MTDPASLTLGIIGVVLPSIELARNIRSVFREIKNAPAQIGRLEHKIQISRDILHKLQPTSESYNGQSRRLIQSLHDDYATSLDRLEGIVKRLGSNPKWKGRCKLLLSQREIQEIEDLVKELEGRINLIVTLSMWNKSLQIDKPPEPLSIISDGHSSNSLHSTSRARENVIKRRDCSLRYCSCSCHQSFHMNSRFWSINYSPFWSLFQRCDRSTCTARRHQISFWVALSQMGIPFAVAVDLAVISKTGTWALVPSLQVRKVQRFTSRGFEILWQCETRQIDWPEAKQAFIDFYRRNPDMGRHVNPKGISYLEHLIRRGPWHWGTGLQFQLLGLFCEDFNLLSELDVSEEFNYSCMRWSASDGLHLHLMSELLHLGFDPSIIAPSALAKLAPGLYRLSGRDIFYLEYVELLLNKDPEFGGTTPLHLSIIYNNKESFEKLAGNESCLENNTNFLGQSPLHIAVHYPTYLSLLLSKGHLVDVKDTWGYTPLYYAIMSNRVDTALLLIDAGADTQYLQHRFRTHMYHAVLNGYYTLIIAIIKRLYYNQRYDDAVFFWFEAIITVFHERPNTRHLMAFLRELLNSIDDPSHAFLLLSSGWKENLFHYIGYQEEGNLLLEYGFTGINQVNSRGEHPLSSVVKYPHAVKFYLESGIEVNLLDAKGRTALMGLTESFSSYLGFDYTPTDIITLRSLLMSGADTRIVDDCRGCACAPQGCSAGDILIQHVPMNFENLSVILWLTTIEEYRETEEAKQSLLPGLRQTLFTQFKVAHICCLRSRIKRTNRNVCEHRRYSKMLDERMDLLKRLSYNELKGLLSQYTARLIVQLEYMIVYRAAHIIDHHNDRFINASRNIQGESNWRKNLDQFEKCVQNDHQQRISEATDSEHERIHKWYKSTMDWLNQVRDMATTLEEHKDQFDMNDDFEMINNLGANAALPVLAVVAGSIFSILATNLFMSS